MLVAMLLFFGALFAALNARPGRDGDQGRRAGARSRRRDRRAAGRERAVRRAVGPARRASIRLRDVVRAIDAARTDARVKAIVLDLDGFGGGYPAALGEVADALARASAQSGKPVLAYATAYTDAGYRLAAAPARSGSTRWAARCSPGRAAAQLYYKGLIDKLGVTTHVYRVGKLQVVRRALYPRRPEPRGARGEPGALRHAVRRSGRKAIARARPKAQVGAVPDRSPPRSVAGGERRHRPGEPAPPGSSTSSATGIAFGARVAEIAGGDTHKPAGRFQHDPLRRLRRRAIRCPTGGDAIGVVTVAGDIVDGKAGPGTAGGDTIAKAILDGLAKNNLKALVVRVDSPGGSALASEKIRLAVLEAKKQGLPVVVSMGGLAASGGYWVSTAGDAIFAEPTTITGSIGIFGIIPTFENDARQDRRHQPTG